MTTIHEERITAAAIVRLLAAKHAKDVFVSECKTGATWTGSHLRLDAWAMKRTWVPPTSVGYEVKVSRSDFLGDEKWPGYLDCCNRFYFVCPKGVIEPAELPADVGLMYVSRTATKLYTKRKAVRRDVSIPEDLYRYILMSRARIRCSARYQGDEISTREYWSRWLDQRAEDRELGHRVGRAIGDKLSEQVHAVTAANELLKAENAKFADLTRLLASMGIDAARWTPDRTVRERAESLRAAVPPELLRGISTVHDALTAFQRHLSELTTPEAG